MAAVYPTPDRQPKQLVEHDEAQPHEEADLSVRDPKVTFDRLHEQREDLPVHEARHIRDRQDGDRIPSLRWRHQPRMARWAIGRFGAKWCGHD